MNNSILKNLIIYEMYQFLERHKLLKLTQRELNHLNRSVSIKEIDESIGRKKQNCLCSRMTCLILQKNPKESITTTTTKNLRNS